MRTGDDSIKVAPLLFLVMLHTFDISENDLRNLYHVSKVQSSKLCVNDTMLCQ